jgi:hypothetical protein
MKVFCNAHVSVHIPFKIYEELTLPRHRVYREYPQLSQLINNLVYNQSHGHPISLTMTKIQNSIYSIPALQAHCLLEDESSIGPGEMEAIPLSIELSGIFISCDADAMAEYQSIADKNGSSGFLFIDYCRSLISQGIINHSEFSAIEIAVTT